MWEMCGDSTAGCGGTVGTWAGLEEWSRYPENPKSNDLNVLGLFFFTNYFCIIILKYKKSTLYRWGSISGDNRYF